MSEWMLFRTSNDRNGNPRAVYVEVDKGCTLQVVDMGYDGIEAARKAGHTEAYAPALFFITPEEYKNLKRMQDILKGMWRD
jgi:hypothetical protein